MGPQLQWRAGYKAHNLMHTAYVNLLKQSVFLHIALVLKLEKTDAEKIAEDIDLFALFEKCVFGTAK